MTVFVESFEDVAIDPVNAPQYYPGALRIGASTAFRFASGLTMVAPVPNEIPALIPPLLLYDFDQGLATSGAANVPTGAAFLNTTAWTPAFTFEVPVFTVSFKGISDSSSGGGVNIAAYDKAGRLITASEIRDVADADWDTNLIQVSSRVPIAKIVIGFQIYVDDLTFDTSKPHIVKGTKFDDRLGAAGHSRDASATNADDFISGKSGNDKINGRGGNDTIDAGKGKDKVDGGDGNDAITGGDGADKLKGGAGQDSFLFGPLGSIDKLKDFDPFDDTIVLSAAVFNAPGTSILGYVVQAAFHIGPAAADADDRIIYDFATGKLFYDIDGTGPNAPIQFALLPVGLPLTNLDFLVA